MKIPTGKLNNAIAGRECVKPLWLKRSQRGSNRPIGACLWSQSGNTEPIRKGIGLRNTWSTPICISTQMNSAKWKWILPLKAITSPSSVMFIVYPSSLQKITQKTYILSKYLFTLVHAVWYIINRTFACTGRKSYTTFATQA